MLNSFINIHSGERRTQALVVNNLKHYYALKSGELKYHKTEAAVKNKANPIRFYMLADSHSQTFYAEFTPEEWPIDLIGFLTRAWHPKHWYFFEGVADGMSVSNTLLKSKVVTDQLSIIMNELEVEQLPAPSFPPWYASHVKKLELSVSEAIWSFEQRGLPTNLGFLDHIGSVCTLLCNHHLKEIWELANESHPLTQLANTWCNKVDEIYNQKGDWRSRLHSDYF